MCSQSYEVAPSSGAASRSGVTVCAVALLLLVQVFALSAWSLDRLQLTLVIRSLFS